MVTNDHIKKLSLFLIIVTSLLLISACKKHTIQVYSTHKEPLPFRRDLVPDKNQLKWVTPAHWKEQTGSGMRLASFKIKNKQQNQAELTIIKLSGKAGGLQANVNRWRNQLGLTPLSEQAIEKQSRQSLVKQHSFTFIDLENNMKRTYAAFTLQKGYSYFFKLMGNPTLIETEKKTFLRFLESLDFGNGY